MNNLSNYPVCKYHHLAPVKIDYLQSTVTCSICNLVLCYNNEVDVWLAQEYRDIYFSKLKNSKENEQKINENKSDLGNCVSSIVKRFNFNKHVFKRTLSTVKFALTLSELKKYNKDDIIHASLFISARYTNSNLKFKDICNSRVKQTGKILKKIMKAMVNRTDDLDIQSIIESILVRLHLDSVELKTKQEIESLTLKSIMLNLVNGFSPISIITASILVILDIKQYTKLEFSNVSSVMNISDDIISSLVNRLLEHRERLCF